MQTIREFFHGKVILIAGATGFLGQALVTKMLTALPDVKRIYLLIRSQDWRQWRSAYRDGSARK